MVKLVDFRVVDPFSPNVSSGLDYEISLGYYVTLVAFRFRYFQSKEKYQHIENINK